MITRKHRPSVTGQIKPTPTQTLVRLLLLLVAALALGACGRPSDKPAPSQADPTFEVDTTLAPVVQSIPYSDGTGSRNVASVSDDQGNRADFVENEVIVALDDPSELDPLLNRLNATVLSQIDVPGGSTTFYVLQVDPAQATPDELVALAADGGQGTGGNHRVSSQRGLDVLAAIARENGGTGAQLGANFLLAPAGDASELSNGRLLEAPTGTGGPPDDGSGSAYNQDAFLLPYMNRGSIQDIGAAEAARMVHDAGRVPAPGNKVRFVIFDGGFSSSADLPTPILPPGSSLDVMNPYECSGGDACPWHGTFVASVALSQFNDGVGVAGPAAEVAQPIFVQSPSPDLGSYIEFILRTLPATLGSNPDIINISASADIPSGFCLLGACSALDVLGNAISAMGIMVFASAGNEGKDVDDRGFFDIETGYIVPCEMPGVICVGGMRHNRTTRHPNSNYSSLQGINPNASIDIYAPYSFWVHDDPDGGTSNAVYVNGTSFSSPFAASIAALMMAADPSLTAGEVWNLMRDTAHPGSESSGVHRRLNAYAAVRAALGGNAPPMVRITSPSTGAESPLNAAMVYLTCSIEDDDPSGLSVSWESDRDGVIASGGTVSSGGTAEASTSSLSYGTHELTCVVEDGVHTVTSNPVTINITNQAPTVSITQPAPGSSYYAGQPIVFQATASDPNNNLGAGAIEWRILNAEVLDAPQAWGGSGDTATMPAGTLSPGRYLVRAIRSDSLGATGDSIIDLYILADPADLPPAILNPSVVPFESYGLDNPPSLFWALDCSVDVNGDLPGNGTCRRLTFSADLSDDNPWPNGGPPFYLDLIPVVWRVYKDEVLIDEVSTTSGASAAYSFTLAPGNYRVTLDVTDSGGNTTTYGTALAGGWVFQVQDLI